MGWWGAGREAHGGGDICVHGQSSSLTAETNTALQSNYTPVKKMYHHKLFVDAIILIILDQGAVPQKHTQCPQAAS